MDCQHIFYKNFSIFFRVPTANEQTYRLLFYFVFYLGFCEFCTAITCGATTGDRTKHLTSGVIGDKITMMTENKRDTNKTAVKIAVAAGAVLLVLLIIALIVNLVRLGAANSRRDELAAQNARLEQLIDKNNGMIDYCESAEFIEEYAREMLDMIYRGETSIGGN